MKVLATVKWVDAIGGAQRSVLDVNGGLAARGHELTVMYFLGEELLPEYHRRGCATIRGLDFYLDQHRRPASLAGLLRSTWRGARVDPDLVYIQDFEHGPLGAMISSVRRTPLVSHLRLTPPASYARQHRAALQRVDRFIAVSNDVRERFVQSGLRRDRIDVVHNGLDLDEFSPGTLADRAAIRNELGLEPEEFVVVYVGRIDHVKGIETAVAACNRRAELGRPVRLVAVGQPVWHESEAEGEEYVERLRRLGAPSRALFVGARTDIVPIYRAADVVVVPSSWPEPFGRVVIEAMACGRPVIASRVGGIPEILTGELESLLFDPGDVEQLVQRLDEVAPVAGDLGLRCREEAAARFGIETVIDGVENTLNRALGAH